MSFPLLTYLGTKKDILDSERKCSGSVGHDEARGQGEGVDCRRQGKKSETPVLGELEMWAKALYRRQCDRVDLTFLRDNADVRATIDQNGQVFQKSQPRVRGRTMETSPFLISLDTSK